MSSEQAHSSKCTLNPCICTTSPTRSPNSNPEICAILVRGKPCKEPVIAVICTKSTGTTARCIKHLKVIQCSRPSCGLLAKSKIKCLCTKHEKEELDKSKLKFFCSESGCENPVSKKKEGKCDLHYTIGRCKFFDDEKKERCQKLARGKTEFCITHTSSGSKLLCNYIDPKTNEKCKKAARGSSIRSRGRGKSDSDGKCIAHGGGKRCQFEDEDTKEKCTHAAAGATDFCKGHGGGNRCQFIDIDGKTTCPLAARSKGGFCVRHGGGPRCSIKDCGNGAISKRVGLCKYHIKITGVPEKHQVLD